MIEFTVPGVPVPKGRPKFRLLLSREVALSLMRLVKMGGGVSEILSSLRKLIQVTTYTPPETREAEDEFVRAAKPFKPAKPLTGALRVDLRFILPSPTRLDSDRSRIWPHVRPDKDNYEKLALDALSAVPFWENDGQVCAGSAIKIYGHPPRTEVAISHLPDVDEAQHSLWGGIA